MTGSDERPAVWIGHVTLPTTDVSKSLECLLKLGCRPLHQAEDIAILELRGGTHLLLLKSEHSIPSGAKAPFDLMVDDIGLAHKECTELGLSPSDIKDVPFHRAFTIVEPAGHEITINSTHVSDKPV